MVLTASVLVDYLVSSVCNLRGAWYARTCHGRWDFDISYDMIVISIHSWDNGMTLHDDMW